MPELSVLMPALNAETTIAQAVRSTLRVMPADAELLVLDDGSSDATAERAQWAADSLGRGKQLRILSNASPSGVAAGLNQLLAASDSRLVGRMDADDVSLPGRFTSCLRGIAAGDDFVFTQVLNRSRRWLWPLPPVRISPEIFPLALLVTNPAVHPTMVARRSALERLEGYRAVPAEDYDLWLRAAVAGFKLRRVAAWGLAYRLHPGQVTKSKGWAGQSWQDPKQAQAFADLATQLVGEPLQRLVSIRLLPEAERRQELRRFDTLVTPAIATVRGAYGVMLRRKLRSRLAWAAQEAPSDLESGRPGGQAR